MTKSRKVNQKILIVDDDAKFRLFLRNMLTEWGYEVVEAEDGIKGLLRIINESPDLVLLDLDMPILSGFRVTEMINNVPDISNIPIIVISGSAMEFKDRLETLGAVAVFSKPLVLEDLHKTIDSIIASTTLQVIEDKSGAAPLRTPARDKGATRPVGDSSPTDWFAPMRGGFPQKTLGLLRHALLQKPGDLEAAGYLKLAESLIVKDFFARYNDPGEVMPRLHPQLTEEITQLNLGPAEGFLLSQMDGRTDLGSLFFVSGMNRFRTSLLLEKLLGEEIVLLEDGRAANE